MKCPSCRSLTHLVRLNPGDQRFYVCAECGWEETDPLPFFPSPSRAQDKAREHIHYLAGAAAELNRLKMR